MAQEAKDETEKSSGYEKQTYIQISTQYGNNVNMNQMPTLGLGTWLSKPGEVTLAVSCALKCGYKHIDCAHIYQNEKEVGAAFDKTDVSRDNVFVTSKLWNTDHHPEDVLPALKKTLSNLKLNYLDLYLIHWPMTLARGDNLFPKDKNDKLDYGEIIPLEDTWKAMEQCVKLGLARHIGLSNFNHDQINLILSKCEIKPAVLQCESHAYFTQKKLKSYCKEKGIVFTAYSPLGNPTRPWAAKGEPSILEDPKLKVIADKKGVTVAHLLIKYQVARGCVVIPKSVKPTRIKSNFEIWDFELNDKELAEIEKFNRDWRTGVPSVLKNGKNVPRDGDHPFFPFHTDY